MGAHLPLVSGVRVQQSPHLPVQTEVVEVLESSLSRDLALHRQLNVVQDGMVSGPREEAGQQVDLVGGRGKQRESGREALDQCTK